MKLYEFEIDYYLIKQMDKYYGLQGTMYYKTKVCVKTPTTLGILLGKQTKLVRDRSLLHSIIEQGYSSTSKEFYEKCYGVEVEPVVAQTGLEYITLRRLMLDKLKKELGEDE